MKYELHPACAAWPPMSDAEIAALAEDIKTHGLIHPIILCDDKILDGRNRELACYKAGIEPRAEIYQGDDPVGFSLSVNLHRRHLPKHKLALIGATLATLKQGAPTGNVNASKTKQLKSSFVLSQRKTRAEVGAQLGVSVERITEAATILRRGAPNVIAMVENGDVPIQPAVAYVRNTPLDEQKKATIAEVKRIGNAIKTGPKPAKSKPAKAAKLPPIEQPWMKTNLTKLDVGAERIPGQPVLLCPAHIQQLRDDRAALGMAAQQILTFCNRIEDKAYGVSAERFAAGLNAMLAYHRVPGKTNGEQEDFAAAARKSLALFEGRIDNAIDWLTAIRAAVHSTKAETKAEQTA